MGTPVVEISFAAELRPFLPSRHRSGHLRLACDCTSTLGHLVESVGVPLPEVGSLAVNGITRPPGYLPRSGDVALVGAVEYPQPMPSASFLLDVHLGKLARRMRLLGVDTEYANDLDDDTLIARSRAGRKILLTQDRGLLSRRALWCGAYVRGARPDEQLADVLARFEPPLAPWTRCTACNGLLAPAAKASVEALLKPGTRRTYHSFSRCLACGRVYWRGAHSDRLESIVASATIARR